MEVTQAGGGEFFARQGLLFQSPEALKATIAQLQRGEPLIHDLASRGIKLNVTAILTLDQVQEVVAVLSPDVPAVVSVGAVIAISSAACSTVVVRRSPP